MEVGYLALHGKYTLMNKGKGLYYGWVVTQVWGWMGQGTIQVWRMDGWVVLSQGWGMDGSGHYFRFGGWMDG